MLGVGDVGMRLCRRRGKPSVSPRDWCHAKTIVKPAVFGSSLRFPTSYIDCPPDFADSCLKMIESHVTFISQFTSQMRSR